MSTKFTFVDAVKYDAKGRVALVGPGGSGKSLTMLRFARLLAGPEGIIAAVDTEQGSLSKYAVSKQHPVPDNVHVFKFKTLTLDSFSPDNFIDALTAAEEAKADVFCCDSLSHFWMGKDGALEFVDERKKKAAGRGGDQMEGWKDFRPHERKMIDRMLASPCHVIVTMRTKNEYINEEYTDGAGKKKTRRLKIGLAPVQREGLDYEFDFVGLMTGENELIVEKTRCSAYAGKLLAQPAAKDFVAFQEWLMGEVAPAIVTAPRPASVATAPITPAAKPVTIAPAPEVSEPLQQLFASIKNGATAVAVFEQLHAQLVFAFPEDQAHEMYSKALNSEGVQSADQFKSTAPARRAAAILHGIIANAPARESAVAA